MTIIYWTVVGAFMCAVIGLIWACAHDNTGDDK